MKPTTRAAWREAGINALTMSVVFILMIPLTRNNWLLSQTVAIAIMLGHFAWRRWHDWSQALAWAGLSVFISLPVSLVVMRLLG